VDACNKRNVFNINGNVLNIERVCQFDQVE